MERLDDILKRFHLRSSSLSAGATGPSPIKEAPAPACPICGDAGWVLASAAPGHPDFGKLLPCQCQEGRSARERQARLLAYSNLESMARSTFETLDPQGRSQDPEEQQLFQEALSAGKAFAQEPKGWLVLTGPSGCGKSHLAAAIAHAVVARGQPALFMHVPDLLDHLRSSYAPETEQAYDTLFEQVRNTPLLVLDDLGSQAPTPWAQEKLLQLLNARFNRELPTVLALSVPLARLEARWRTRLEDRRLSKVLALAKQTAPVYGHLGVPTQQQLRDMTFETFDVRGNKAEPQQRASLKAAQEAAQDFAQNPEGNWLALVGNPGVGKTHLAVAIHNYRRSHGQQAFFAFVPDLLDYLRFTYQPTSAVSYDEFFEQLKSMPLLILDDLGSQRSSPWAEEKLYQVIAYRHAARLPTVITMSDEERLSPPVASRLRDVHFVSRFPMEAPDYRDQGTRPQQGTGAKSQRLQRR